MSTSSYNTFQDLSLVYSSDDDSADFYFEEQSADNESTTLMGDACNTSLESSIDMDSSAARQRQTTRSRHQFDQEAASSCSPCRRRRRRPTNTLRAVLIFLAFTLAIGSALIVVLVLGEDTNDISDWLALVRDFGYQGSRAQGIANKSPIHFYDDDSQSPYYYAQRDGLPLLGSIEYDKNETLLATEEEEDASADDDSEEERHKPSHPPEGCESTVMLLRHCEKGALKSHCNYMGYERATYLASLFGSRWPSPSKIYALQTKRKHHDNLREIETVQQVADKATSGEIDEGFGSSHIKKLSNTILESITSGDMCGKLILVAWKHSEIPALAHHLGCGPLQGCPINYNGKLFDEVWQIKYVFRSFYYQGGSIKQQATKKKTKKRRHRHMHTHNHTHHRGKAAASSPKITTATHQHWDLFGSVQSENFDPLAFSYQAGDYPMNGTSHGARWNQKSQVKFFG